MARPINWGVISTGNIANTFAETIAAMDDGKIVAVGSRTQTAASEFGMKHGITRRYANYAAVANDPDVEVVYVATPHVFHADNVRMCLEAGKHVLCEKPFTINAAEAEEIVALAREKNLFLMEAMWTRFLPAIATLRAWVADGRIGQPMALHANFVDNLPFDPEHRLFKRELGGGALLDVGVYVLSFAVMLFGIPDQVESTVRMGPSGVDAFNTLYLRYDDGRSALLTSGQQVKAINDARIVGTDGMIEVPEPFFVAEKLVHYSQSGQPTAQEFPLEVAGLGFTYEIREVHERIRAGETQSPILPLDESIAIMRLMDTIREPWGLRYPADAVR